MADKNSQQKFIDVAMNRLSYLMKNLSIKPDEIVNCTVDNEKMKFEETGDGSSKPSRLSSSSPDSQI